MSQSEPLATSSPLTCTVFTLAGPPGTVSFVCCAVTLVARLRAAALTRRTPHVLEAACSMMISFDVPPRADRDSPPAGGTSGGNVRGARLRQHGGHASRTRSLWAPMRPGSSNRRVTYLAAQECGVRIEQSETGFGRIWLFRDGAAGDQTEPRFFGRRPGSQRFPVLPTG